MTRVHGSIGLIDWGDDANGGAILVDEREQNDTGAETDEAIARALEETEDESPQQAPSHSLSRTGSGSSGVSNSAPNHDTRRHDWDAAASGRRDRNVGQSSSSHSQRDQQTNRKGNKNKSGGRRNGPRRPMPRYEDREEFSEDENDDFGGGAYDYDYVDMNWESL
ncbi:hypothetical protein FRC17_000925 [Serendipita sp. 399]|nr:hypothetical protein FRC17_000925 [Serendipita sp. 399]